MNHKHMHEAQSEELKLNIQDAFIKPVRKRIGTLTSQPLSKAGHEQLWPQLNHLLLANNSTMQEPPAIAREDTSEGFTKNENKNQALTKNTL